MTFSHTIFESCLFLPLPKCIVCLFAEEYFGSFDMVLVDLSETVMSFKVTQGLDIMEALTLLLKPDGIFVKNGKREQRLGIDVIKKLT